MPFREWKKRRDKNIATARAFGRIINNRVTVRGDLQRSAAFLFCFFFYFFSFALAEQIDRVGGDLRQDDATLVRFRSE